MTREIYLDNNATTPLDPKVEEAMLPFAREFFGNPSSLHKKGLEAERGIKEARRVLADMLHVKTSEVFFTSGATEADNLAVLGTARAYKKRGNHIITQKTEHEAVLASCHALEKEGFDVTYLDVDKFGNVKAENLLDAISDKTTLISIMHVNNEIGTVYPINELARIAKRKKHDIIFFSDGVQALGKLEVDLSNIDLYAISAHKIHGPKGVGALIKKEATNLEPIIYGGGQESGLRGGTENVAGIVGMGKAVVLAYEDFAGKLGHFNDLREKFLFSIFPSGSTTGIEGVQVNPPTPSGGRWEGVPTIINVGFRGIPAEVLLHALEEEGIYASSGSACASNKNHVSHVLEAINVPSDYIKSSLRFGFSRFTTLEDIDFTCEVLKKKVNELRKVTSNK